jgi:hypothetical protein
MPGIYATSMRDVRMRGRWPEELVTLALHCNTMRDNFNHHNHINNYLLFVSEDAQASCHPNATNSNRTLVLRQLDKRRERVQRLSMPRQARLDAPGTLHHVMGRGIEGNDIFRVRKDREDFLDRLATVCEEGGLICYAWALMSNHFHLLAEGMRKILTG